MLFLQNSQCQEAPHIKSIPLLARFDIRLANVHNCRAGTKCQWILHYDGGLGGEDGGGAGTRWSLE